MNKIVFEKGRLIVYAKDEKEAQAIIGIELSKFNEIRMLLAELVTENGSAWKNFMINISDQTLNMQLNDDTSLIFDEDSTGEGKVRQQMNEDDSPKIDSEGNYSYELAYRYPDIGEDYTYESIYRHHSEIYGDKACFILAHEIASLMLKPSGPSRQKHNSSTKSTQVEGLIRVPKGKEKRPNAMYGTKMQESAINLLAQLAIRKTQSADDILTSNVDLSESNSYKKCDQLVKLLVVAMRNDFDEEISFEQLMEQKIDSIITHSDGTQEPANTFLYGMVNDSCIIELDFDRYMGKGAWRRLDSIITRMHSPNITQNQAEKLFDSAQLLIIEFANKRMQEKHKDAVDRDGAGNVPELENKIKMIKEMTGIELCQDIEKGGRQKFIAPELSLKQKVAQFLRNHDIFMNLTFIENFVNKQLNVFPTNESSAKTAKRRLKDDFENWLSNNGEFKNLPTPQRMPNPGRIARIQKKNEIKASGR